MDSRSRLLALALLAPALTLTRTAAAQDAPAEDVPEAQPSPQPSPRADVSPPPPPVPAEVEMPATTCAAQAYAQAGDAVVRVDSGGRSAAGALVADSRHVVTVLRVVEQGHGITVTDARGNQRRAHIVLTADSDELAMLELDAALPGAPLPIAPWDAVTVGMQVVLVGAPSPDAPHGLPGAFRGTLPWAVSEGVVASRGERGIQADVQIATMRGSPIVSCAGELVAVLGPAHERMRGPVVHAMPAVPALGDLASRLDRPESYGGRWNLTGGLALGAVYEDPDWLWGGTLMVGVVGLDAFVLVGRASYFRTSFEPDGADTASVTKDRIRGDAYVGWRQILVFGRMAMHFELALGASVTRWRREARIAEVVDDGGGPAVRFRRDETSDWSVRPMAVVNLFHGPMLISYTLEFDVDREHFVHLFNVGARF